MVIYHKLQRIRVFLTIVCLLLSVGILFTQSGCSGKTTYSISGTVTSGRIAPGRGNDDPCRWLFRDYRNDGCERQLCVQ